MQCGVVRRPFRRSALSIAAWIVLGALPGEQALAACTLAGAATWLPAGAGSWSLAGAWSTGVSPNSSSTNVCITNGTSAVTLDLSRSVASFSLGAGNTLGMNDNTALTIYGSQINNAGTIALNSGGNYTDLVIASGGTTTLQGGGSIVLNDRTSNRIYSNAAGSVLDNVDNTISGAGQIFANAGMQLKNESAGIIDATGFNALTLSNFNGSSSVLNTGILRSSNTTAGNGGLVIYNSTVDNTGNLNGGRINAIGANTHVDLYSSTILGGTLTSSGGGVIQTLSGTTNALVGTGASINIAAGTSVVVRDNSVLKLSGAINNAGSIQVNSTGNGTWLQFADGTQLSGGGAITLSDSAANYLFGAVNNGLEVLTNVDNTISGAGQLSTSNLMLVINKAAGLINANGTQMLIVSPATNNTTGLITANGGGFVNQGTMKATNIGGLGLSGGVFNNKGGSISAVGSGNNVYLYNNTTVAGGLLQGVNGGMVETIAGHTAHLDGASQGALTLAGTYLANDNSSTFVSGTFNNTGTLRLNSNGNGTSLHFADGTVLTGAGNITLSDNANNLIWGGANSGAEVVTNVNNTISGAGLIGASNSFLFIN